MKDIDLPLSFKSPLDRFTRDLTAAALYDELEPVRCRDGEIDSVITTLLRQSKNNPVLIGEAGVGKTAVVEGLAQRLSVNRVPSALKNLRILSLSHIDLIAGTSFRGQYEKRLQSVIDEASESADTILFIDELHNLIGAGSALGAPMDAANMLKPALASGQIRLIGATTEYEYKRYIQADAALERRFQPVRIEELGRAQTLEVLRARQPRLEMHHLLAIAEDAVEAATDLSIKYLPGRKQPDRSIDLLDETCARVRLFSDREPPERVMELKLERDRLVKAEQEAIRLIAELADARGTALERFSLGAFKVFEAMGLGVEKLLTGRTTERSPLPPPDSIRRLQENDPAERLADLHCERLQLEDRLREILVEHDLTVAARNIEATLQSLRPAE